MQANPNITPANLLFTLSRIVLGAVFVYASWDKILDPAAFSRIIANYQIVSYNLGNLIALFLPWLEVVCGICLITNRFTLGSATITAALMVVFIGALGYNIYRGIDVHCGCFTLTEEAPGSMWGYLIRDVLFLAIAIWIIIHRIPAQRSPSPA